MTIWFRVEICGAAGAMIGLALGLWLSPLWLIAFGVGLGIAILVAQVPVYNASTENVATVVADPTGTLAHDVELELREERLEDRLRKLGDP
jgi:hypothetical protein